MTSSRSAAGKLRFGVIASTLLLFAAGLLLTTVRTATQDLGTVRFAVIGDFGKAGTNEADVAAAIHSWNPDFIATVGDNNYERGGADTIDVNIGQYYHDYIYPYLGSYGAGATINRFFPSLGNHDWGDGFVLPPTAKPYTDYFTLPNNERYYDVVQGPVHLFALASDSYEPDGNTPTSVQGVWAQTQLAASTSPWNIVVFHEPPYSSSAHPSGTEEANMRQWPFRDWGVTAVMAGHHHLYERLLEQNTPYFIDGLGGNSKDNFTFPLTESQLRYNGDYGAILVTASSSKITFQFITRTGALIDSYSIDAPAGPGAPNNLVATPVPTGRIDLWWTDHASDEQGFAIERSDDGGSTFNEVTRVAANVTSYTDMAVNQTPTAYSYRVRAFKADATTTAYSNVATTATVPNPPFAPSVTASPVNTSSISLTWSDVGNETGYRVYRLVNNVFNFIATLPAGTVQYTDTGRAASTTYTYEVRAFNAGGESTSSNDASTTTLPQLPAPSGLTATAVSGSEVDLTWVDNTTSESGFKILRSTDGVNFTVAAWAGANTTSYANTGRTPSTTYYYKVRAYESTGGESPDSNIVSVTTLSGPAAPSNVTATAVTSSRIDLSWTDNSTTEAAFRIYRSTDGVNFAFQSQVAANVTTYSNTGLSPSTKYYYYVTAKESGGAESVPSNVDSATTLALALGAPTNLTAVAKSATQVVLSWTDNASAETGFKVYRSTDGTNFSFIGTSAANVTTYTNGTVVAATTYYYEVLAYDSAGHTSGYSNVAVVTTPSVPNPPSGLTATATSSTQITLAWTDNSTNETNFRIDRSTDGVNFATVAWVGANVTSYQDNGRTPGITYYYQVRSYGPNGSSAPTNTASATTH